MKILIPGGSGQVGTILARAFYRLGHEVVVLSRNPGVAPWRVVLWDGISRGGWTAELETSDVVIQLAGRSVNCRYNPRNRAEILSSRVDSTRILGQAIQDAQHRPGVWLQASTATIYSHLSEVPNGEYTGTLGGGEPDLPDTWRFSLDVASAWEKTATAYATSDVRQVLLRSAIIMSPDEGGAFDRLLGLVRWGLGGTCGTGKQYVSWIHEADFVQAVLWLIHHQEFSGAVNLASPNPLTNAEFMQLLRNGWGASLGLPAAQWMLEFGALFLKTESELVLKSRRVVPCRLLESGFAFQFESWETAARALCADWRAQHSGVSVRGLGRTALGNAVDEI